MPIDTPHLPADMLTIGRLTSAAPGTLYLKALPNRPGPVLSVRDPSDQLPRPYGLMLDPTALPNSRFAVFDVGRDQTTWIGVQRWRLVVDAASAFSPQTGTQQEGDAFVAAGVHGFLGAWPSHQAFVATTGEITPEPTDVRDFAYFRSWSIVMDLPGHQQPVTVLSRSREA